MFGVVPLPLGALRRHDLVPDDVLAEGRLRLVAFVVDPDAGAVGPELDQLARQHLELALALGDGVDGDILRVLALFCKSAVKRERSSERSTHRIRGPR